MERICYCPSDDLVEEAMELALPWGIHVQTGESQATEALDFDRDKVQILNIPIEQHFKISDPVIRPYQTLACNYVDEFTLVGDVCLAYDGPQGTTEVGALMSGDPHYKGWRVRFPSPGEYEVRIYDKDGDIASEKITVNPW